jgi:hypothetical protein
MILYHPSCLPLFHNSHHDFRWPWRPAASAHTIACGPWRPSRVRRYHPHTMSVVVLNSWQRGQTPISYLLYVWPQITAPKLHTNLCSWLCIAMNKTPDLPQFSVEMGHHWLKLKPEISRMQLGCDFFRKYTDTQLRIRTCSNLFFRCWTLFSDGV